MLCQHLEDEGYTCTGCTAPSEALALLDSDNFELLITDLKMPEMHGTEVVREAKVRDSLLSVIVVTAMLDVTNAIDALRAGADDYILKPFNLAEITAATHKAIEKRALILENRRHREELEKRVGAATADLAAANAELRRTKEYLEKLLDSTLDAVLTADANNRISYVNNGAVGLFGFTREEVLGRPTADFFVGGQAEVQYVGRLIDNEQRLKNYETEIRSKSGTYIPVSMSLSTVQEEPGAPPTTLAICKDITEQKRLERELKEMSIKDSLTGLYNQRYFYDRLEAEIERARRQGHALSLLLFDVDSFKKYNDCHGHLEGDRVLAAVGSVVSICTREHVDVGFRYGGDEFTVILPEADEDSALAIAERIRTTFAQRHNDELTLSIGLMTYKQGSSLRSFIRFADAMMYDAKRSGGNRVFIYRPDAGGAEEPQESYQG